MDGAGVNLVPSSNVSTSSSARSTPVHMAYKPITPSSSLLALSKTPDDEIRRKSQDELLHIVRRLEAESRNIVAEHSSILKDVNKKMQILLLEVRGLKDINQNLQDDNQELRDLCCFLDDDRQRGRKLAREWQRFGRYTASVMRSEVSAYQEKLKELEGKQQELITDNLDLKELCLYLDQERLRASQPRDEGDGSSSSTVAGNEDGQADIELVPVSELQGGRNTVDGNTGKSDYIRQLENRVKSLEKEKQANGPCSQQGSSSSLREAPLVQVTGTQRVGPDGTQAGETSGKGTSPNKPEAVVHAMKVLEVHENLERQATEVGEESSLDDKEKAIVREMCNVVWRKLGSVKAEKQQGDPPPPAGPPPGPPVYENLGPAPRSKSTPPSLPHHISQSSVSPEDNIYPPGYQQVQSHGQRLQGGQGMSAVPGVGQYDPRDPRIENTGDRRHGAIVNMNSSYSAGSSQQYGEAEFRVPDSYQLQGVGPYQGQQRNVPPSSSQSQRPPPASFQQGQDAHSVAYYATGQPQNSQVHSSRSTPVTPTPQLQTNSPAPGQRMEPRSHSSGPARRAITPKGTEVYEVQSPVPHRAQYSRSEHQMAQGQGPVYQNHPPTQRADNSYENVPSGYNYTSSQQSFSSGPTRTQDSVSENYDYQPTYSSYSDDNNPPNKYPQTNRPVSQNVTSQNPRPTQSRHVAQGQPQGYYQNMQGGQRGQTPSKSNVRDPSPQGSRKTLPSQPHPSASGPQLTTHRATPTKSGYQSYPGPPNPQVSGQPNPAGAPPGYNAPPAYDRRTSYADNRDGNHQYPERRDPREQYYRK
ncbi:coiled-coil domain-containing protein 85A-like [Mya arenaria]|nr:coiled-coil domain-containing protein 85A-like [Mya arenaria]